MSQQNIQGFFLDITILDTEINKNHVIEKLYGKLHLFFVEISKQQGQNPIGIGFPKYIAPSQNEKHQQTLGNEIRLFSLTQNNLNNNLLKSILENMKEYIYITTIQNIPPTDSYAVYKRIQPTPTPQRLAKRKAKRQNISLNIAITDLQKNKTYKQKKLKLPYINVKSFSSNQNFKLFIQKLDTKNFIYNSFNTYGLSNTSTIPLF